MWQTRASSVESSWVKPAERRLRSKLRSRADLGFLFQPYGLVLSKEGKLYKSTGGRHLDRTKTYMLFISDLSLSSRDDDEFDNGIYYSQNSGLTN